MDFDGFLFQMRIELERVDSAAGLSREFDAATDAGEAPRTAAAGMDHPSRDAAG